MIKVGYLVSHPIQYQAPLMRLLSGKPDVDLDVYFRSSFSTGAYYDAGFGGKVEWDVPLLDGYRSSTLPPHALNRLNKRLDFSEGLFKHLAASEKAVLWIHGFANPYYAYVIERALRQGIQVLIRDEVQETGNRRSPWKEKIKGAILRSWAKRGVGFLAIGKLNRDYYISKGVDPANIFLVPYAVDRTFFERLSAESRAEIGPRRDALGLDRDATVVLFASKFMERKRGLDLIEAFRLAYPRLLAAGVKKPTLAFAGSGDQAEALEAAAQGLPVVFLGFQNQQALARLFGVVDLFVLPSRHEPWGLVVNEAMSAGLPVIVSDEVGCWPDLVSDGVNGFVFPVGDQAALAEALFKALSDPARLAAMGDESRRIIDGWGYNQDIDGFMAAVSWSKARQARQS